MLFFFRAPKSPTSTEVLQHLFSKGGIRRLGEIQFFFGEGSCLRNGIKKTGVEKKRIRKTCPGLWYISVSQEPPRSASKINRHTLMTILTLFSTPLIDSFNLQFGNKFLPTTIWIHSPNLGPLKPPESLKAACEQRKSHVGVDTIDAHLAAQQRRL